jgi:hypothetical protein
MSYLDKDSHLMFESYVKHRNKVIKEHTEETPHSHKTDCGCPPECGPECECECHVAGEETATHQAGYKEPNKKDGKYAENEEVPGENSQIITQLESAKSDDELLSIVHNMNQGDKAVAASVLVSLSTKNPELFRKLATLAHHAKGSGNTPV